MPTSSGRRKAGQRRPAVRRRKAGRARAESWHRLFRLLRDLLPLFALLAVFLAVLSLDPEGVVRLLWACMTGDFGTAAQLGVSVAVIAGGAVVAWALWQPEPTDPKRRPASRGSRQRRKRAAADRPDATAEPGRRRRNPASKPKPDAGVDAQPSAAADTAPAMEDAASPASAAPGAEAARKRRGVGGKRKAARATGGAADPSVAKQRHG